MVHIIEVYKDGSLVSNTLLSSLSEEYKKPISKYAKALQWLYETPPLEVKIDGATYIEQTKRQRSSYPDIVCLAVPTVLMLGIIGCLMAFVSLILILTVIPGALLWVVLVEVVSDLSNFFGKKSAEKWLKVIINPQSPPLLNLLDKSSVVEWALSLHDHSYRRYSLTYTRGLYMDMPEIAIDVFTKILENPAFAQYYNTVKELDVIIPMASDTQRSEMQRYRSGIISEANALVDRVFTEAQATLSAKIVSMQKFDANEAIVRFEGLRRANQNLQ